MTDDQPDDLIHCTKEAPWDRRPLEHGQRVRHHDAREVGEQESGWPSGDIVRMQCQNCGHEWKSELPQ